jgi:hypothetical protein
MSDSAVQFHAQFYAKDLAKTVRQSQTTKVIFSIIFFVVAVTALGISVLTKLNGTGSEIYWFFISIFFLITGVFIIKRPMNVRKLIKPSQIHAEINIADYYWLLHMMQHFPAIKNDIQTLLNNKARISFDDLDKIWIKLGEFKQASKLSEQFFATQFNMRNTDLEKVKQLLLQ